MAKPKNKPTSEAKAAHSRMGTVEPGDEVYAHHHQRGPMAVKVLAHGRDGFTGEDDKGARHSIGWDRMLGHKKRVAMEMKVLDQGAEGAIVQDGRGKRRFLAGDVGTTEPTQPRGPAPKADPLMEGLETLGKSLAGGGRVIFAKAALANAPGLALRPVTDKLGHQTKRWVRTMKDQPAAQKPKALDDKPTIHDARQTDLEEHIHKHGDVVSFQHGNVRGTGTITSSGRDGVTVQDESGTSHQVRHDALSAAQPKRPAYPEKQAGEKDKAYLKRVKNDIPDPDHLPEDHGRYFNMGEGVETVPIDKLVSTKSDEENAQGGNNSPKFMLAAYHGQVEKRDPIEVEKHPDGTYRVTDGNGTLTGVKKHGWKSLPVKVKQPAAGGGGQVPELFKPEEADLPAAPSQPTKDPEELFAKSHETLAELQEWLDRDKGICPDLGYKTMTTSPEKADMTQPGGMLFIAGVKGMDRARQKVETDYGGDWSKLRDTVRCSIAVDTMADLEKTMAALRAGGMELAAKPKDRMTSPTESGYRDISMNVRFKSGIIGEVQLHLKSMLVAKSAGHKHYETERSLQAEAQKAGPPPDLAPEKMAQLEDARKKQIAIYGAAWQKVQGGGGEPMTKAMRVGGGAAAGAAEARGVAAGAKAGAKAGGGFTYLEHEGAYFRRGNDRAPIFRAVDDVLHGDQWKPYAGDRLAPAEYGSVVEDPLAKAASGDAPPADPDAAPMAKGGWFGRVLFFWRKGR